MSKYLVSRALKRIFIINVAVELTPKGSPYVYMEIISQIYSINAASLSNLRIKAQQSPELTN